jgi:hypothetical protein
MTVIYWRILFFSLIPAGIFLLVKGIQWIRRSFNGAVLLEIPYLQKNGQFAVLKAGYFSIWQKGRVLKRTPVNEFRPRIYNELTNEEVHLRFSLLRPQTNSFSVGRMERCTFFALPGNYKLELKEGASVSKLESWVAKAVPLPAIDLAKYFIQVRASQAPGFIFLAIPVMLLGAFGIIGGFVLGILASQIIK